MHSSMMVKKHILPRNPKRKCGCVGSPMRGGAASTEYIAIGTVSRKSKATKQSFISTDS